MQQLRSRLLELVQRPHLRHRQQPQRRVGRAGLVLALRRGQRTLRPAPRVGRERGGASCQRLGWRLDIDFSPTPNTRGVQFTPPGSPASIQFGQGTTTMTQPCSGSC
jgi:hypothetical protein